MAKNGGWLLRSYNFRGRDPEADRMQTLYQKQHITEDDLAALAGLSTSTVKKFFDGTTQKAQFSTYQKLAHAMGKHYTMTGDVVPNYARDVPKAKEERKEYRAWQREKRERAEAKKK
jgi:transcriptional regulator with XRE-family HTH domain